MAKALVFRLPREMDSLIPVSSDEVLAHYDGKWMTVTSEFIETPNIKEYVQTNLEMGVIVVDVAMVRPPAINFVNGMN